MTKRKILMLAMALCMAAILVVGGTLAYFTDDEQATNTFTIGNVQIDIDEYTYDWDTGDWSVFEDDEFTLYPIENAKAETMMNKVVYTANTSSSHDDAYIRNIVLFEANTLLDETFVGEGNGCCAPLIGLHFGFNTADVRTGSDGKKYYPSTNYTLDATVKINDKDYWVVVFTEANDEAIPYDAALYSLHTVWMDKNVTLDQAKGWGEDNQVDVIVYSQGIQAEGLTHEQAMEALGEVNEANLQKWLDGEDYVDATWTQK